MMRFKTTLLLGFLFLAQTAFALEDEGVTLRRFVSDAIGASASDPASQAEAIRKVLATNPEIFEWAVDGKDFGDIYGKADLTALTTSMGSSGDLETLLNLAMQASGPAQKPLRMLAKNFADKSESERMKLLRIPGDTIYQEFASRVNGKIEDLKLSETDALKTLNNPEHSIHYSNPAVNVFINQILPNYFDSLDVAHKRGIIQGILKTPPFSPIEVQLAAVLSASGPVLQKTFQLVSKDANSPLMRGVLEKLESNIEPFSTAEARRMIEKNLSQPIETVFSSFGDEPIAAGTIGQAHVATLRATGEKVVVKVRRPRIKDSAHAELTVLKRLVRGTSVAELVGKLEDSLSQELDFRIEASNLESGEAYVQPKLGIKIAPRIDSIPAFEDMLVLSFADGRKLSSFNSAEDLAIRGQAAYNVLQRWFDEALFGSGFFHGDLHPGNLFLRRVPGGNPPFQVTILDFGNAGKLTLQQRRGFVRLFLSVISQSTEQTVQALGEIGTLPESSKAIVGAKIAEIFATRGSVADRLTAILFESLSNGFELPSSLLTFNRGRLFLEKELEDVNRRLDAVDPKRKMARYEPSKAYARIAARRTLKDLFKSDGIIEMDSLTGMLKTYSSRVLGHMKPCPTYLKPGAQE